jgi:hypothetical protein
MSEEDYNSPARTSHPHSDPTERGRGIFTPEVDRPFLINHEGSPADRAEYTRHTEIRQRLYDSIADFQLAHRHIDEWNWRKFLDLEWDDPDSKTTRERNLRNGMAAAIAVFYEIHHAKDWGFSNTLKTAIHESYTTGVVQRGMPHRGVENIDINVETYEAKEYGTDVERVAQKLEEDAELTDEEVRIAAQHGWFSALKNHFSKEKRQARKREQSREEWLERLSFGDFDE